MKDIEKINESDISLQEKVRKNLKDCDHIGFFTPLGHEVFYSEDEENYEIVTSVLCMMCGKIFHQLSEIEKTNQAN